MTSPLLAAALAGGSMIFALPGRPPLPAGPVVSRPPGSGQRHHLLAPAFLAPALLAPVLLALMVAPGVKGTHLGLGAVAALATIGALRLVAGARQSGEAARRRQQVVDYCEAMAGELRAGQPVLRAVERSVEVWPEAGSVVAAARLGADVPTALRRLAALPGAAGVARLAGAWELCAETGSGLAFAVEQVLETARSEQATARLVRGELASARATARLVTALPIVVLLAADGIGAQPWRFLLSTAPGVLCLGFGVGLALLGLRWIDRIAMAATQGGH